MYRHNNLCEIQSTARRSVASGSSSKFIYYQIINYYYSHFIPQICSTLCEEMSFNNLIHCISNPQTKPAISPKPNLASISAKMVSPNSPNLDATDSYQDQDFVPNLITKGQYLTKHQWNTFIGSDELKKYSRKIIERNDNIWG